MNKIFIYLFFIISGASAQTYSIQDPVKIGLRATLAASIGAELALKEEQKKLVKEIAELEEEYQEKVSVQNNLRDLPMVTSVLAMLEFSQDKVDELKGLTNHLLLNPMALKHGLSDYRSRLKKYNSYLIRLRSNYHLYIGSLMLSNGQGDIQATFLKLLTRTLDLRNDILDTEREIKNLTVLNKFIKSRL